MMNRFFLFLVAFHLFLPLHSTLCWADPDKIFETKYVTILYADEGDLDDFIWRLGGSRLEFVNDPELVSYRIDRLVNRVQMILDMWPEDFRVKMRLHRGQLKDKQTAYFEYASQTIHVSVDYVSDGIVAHEIAHANINQYFEIPPPGKIQEILAQYVDMHLWSDYH